MAGNLSAHILLIPEISPFCHAPTGMTEDNLSGGHLEWIRGSVFHSGGAIIELIRAAQPMDGLLKLHSVLVGIALYGMGP